MTWAERTMQKFIRKYRFGALRAKEQDLIPYSGRGPVWQGPPHEGDAWWTNGFWAALMWQLHDETKEELFLTEARRVEERLVRQLDLFTGLHHDVGFLYLLSCGADAFLTGNQQMRLPTLRAANVLAARFNPKGFLRAWNGEGREGWAIIDSLMNLPLLSWASRLTGDPRFSHVARIHADSCIRDFQREDGSCDHIVVYDAATGAVLDRPAGQGCCPGSSWSRGQAWALYGFTLAWLNLGDARYLQAALRAADYFVAHIRPDGLTDCDFAQPRNIEKIDNIAGACAASALLTLCGAGRDPRCAAWREAAVRMLRAMGSLCADWKETHCGALTRCTAAYHDEGAGTHVNIVYGDYFFLESLRKLRGNCASFWTEGPDP